MKRAKTILAGLLAGSLLLTTFPAGAAEVYRIPGSSSYSGDIEPGEAIRVDGLCGFVLLSCTFDTYAAASALAEKAGEAYSEAAALYSDAGKALEAKSREYRLMDVQVSILNRKKEDMDIAATVTASTLYDDYYEFDPIAIKEEGPDNNGIPHMYLEDLKPLPMLVERIYHYVFEVPEIVETDEEAPLVVTFAIGGETYELLVR